MEKYLVIIGQKNNNDTCSAKMAGWVEITVAVIGSSLIGFLLTNLALDYDQPKIRINVEKTFENMTQKRYDTTLTDRSMGAARCHSM